MEKKSLIASLKIQIIISFFLIVSGILAYNLIQKSIFKSSDLKDSKNKTTSISTDSKKKPTITRSSKSPKLVKPYNFTKINFDEDHSGNVEDPEFISLQSSEIDKKQEEVITKARLNEFSYDGYMKVGNSEIVWIKIGPERISASEGSIIVDNVVIEEIHENYLVVKDRDNNLTQNIPFTGTKDNSRFAIQSNRNNNIIGGQKSPNINNSYVQAQRTVIQDRNKNNTSNTERPTNVNTRKDQNYDMPPQIPLDDAPPMPW